MKYSAIFSHASRLRESGNRFILAELEKVGLSDIAPSHGDDFWCGFWPAEPAT